MANIQTAKNLNRFIKKSGKEKSLEEKSGWYLWSSVHQRIPALALRNYASDEGLFWSWNRGRNLDIALDVVISILRGWQAFRPVPYNEVKDELKRLSARGIIRIQNVFRKWKCANARDISQLTGREYYTILFKMAELVAELSMLKTPNNPMLGSKVMNFMMPEFFPMWDTAWIGKALAEHDYQLPDKEDWLPSHLLSRLEQKEYANAALEYAWYLAIMFEDMDTTPRKESKKAVANYINHSEVPKKVFEWFIDSADTLVFERCLLGMYREIF